MRQNPCDYKAWLIDLDGTLYHARPVKLAMAAELLMFGPQALGLLRSFRHEHELLRSRLQSPVASPFRIQLERTAVKMGQTATEVEKVVSEWMFDRPLKWIRRFHNTGLLRGIADFRRGGGRTALVSDYPAQKKLTALAADRLFDFVVANGESASPLRLKPHADGYLAAAGSLGVQAADCLVIGDRPQLDGLAAQQANIDFLDVKQFKER